MFYISFTYGIFSGFVSLNSPEIVILRFFRLLKSVQQTADAANLVWRAEAILLFENVGTVDGLVKRYCGFVKCPIPNCTRKKPIRYPLKKPKKDNLGQQRGESFRNTNFSRHLERHKKAGFQKRRRKAAQQVANCPSADNLVLNEDPLALGALSTQLTSTLMSTTLEEGKNINISKILTLLKILFPVKFILFYFKCFMSTIPLSNLMYRTNIISLKKL